MNVSFLLCVPIMLGFAIFFAHRREQQAEFFYRYYNSRPDPKWRRRWLPWAFRPTPGQAKRNVVDRDWRFPCRGRLHGHFGVCVNPSVRWKR
jgi:hypothetical protein